MSVIYSDALANARLQLVTDAIGSGGVLEIGTVGMGAVLATVPLNNPPFKQGPRQIELLGVPLHDGDAAQSGTAVVAQIKDDDGNVVISGLTVGPIGSGANIEMSNVNVQQHQIVDLVSGVIIHP